MSLAAPHPERRVDPVLAWIRRSSPVKLTLIAIAAPLAGEGLALAAEWYAVSPVGYGGRHVLIFASGGPLGLLAAMLVTPVVALAGLASTPVSRWRRRGLAVAAAALSAEIAYTALGLPMLRLHWPVRRSAFHAQARRGDVLVDAIRRYERDHTRPPAALDSLVPGYLSDPQRTGMPAYPRWTYLVGPSAMAFRREDEEGGCAPCAEAWVLFMSCPRGLMGWDSFMYFPSEDYPDAGYGGSVERIGRWAYVHE